TKRPLRDRAHLSFGLDQMRSGSWYPGLGGGRSDAAGAASPVTGALTSAAAERAGVHAGAASGAGAGAGSAEIGSAAERAHFSWGAIGQLPFSAPQHAACRPQQLPPSRGSAPSRSSARQSTRISMNQLYHGQRRLARGRPALLVARADRPRARTTG